MAVAANLQNTIINVSSIAEHGRKELIAVLDSMHGKKGLVLDQSLSGPLGLIAEVALLREHGVEKIYHLDPNPLETECKNVVYIVRPKMHLMKHIASHIHAHAKAGQKKEYSVFFVPRRTMICERMLEEEGVAEVTLKEYPLDLVPFDEDVLSLELPEAFSECYLDGDTTSLYYVARSLMRLQALFGVFPSIVGKGTCAKQVMDMMLRMRKELGQDELPVAPEIDSLVLIDRRALEADLVTPMCTQLTYEGLIDELFGITNGMVDITPDGGAGAAKRTKVSLNSSDELYAEIRDLNFGVLGPMLNKKARFIDEHYKERHQAQTVSQIRDFMKKLGGLQQEHQSLRVHTTIAEKIQAVTGEQAFHSRLEVEQALLVGTDLCNDYVESCINRSEPLASVLRLLALQSLTNNGLKSKHLDFFRKEVLQAYGYEHLITLHDLERMGIIKRQESRGGWSTVRKAFKLIVDDVDEENPRDIAFTFSGYAPLSVRLVQQAVQPNAWRGVEDALGHIPGPAFAERQTPPAGVRPGASARPVTLVFFIGGVTSAEISALRFLGQSQGRGDEGRRDYVVATTKLISGASLLKTLVANPAPGSGK